MIENALIYKKDWDTCKSWLSAWLRGEVGEHWALGVLAPREMPLPVAAPPPPPADPRERWLDIDGNWLRSEAAFAKNYYGGIFHPFIAPHLGPGSLSLFLGAIPQFLPDTVWHEPCFTDPAKVDLHFSPENPYWQWTVQALTHYKKVTVGKCLLAMPELLDGLDVLAQLFGTEELLMHLVDCPEEIHRLLAQVDEIFFRLYDELRAIAVDADGGNALTSYQVWGPGRTMLTQCDFSTMISPDMFAEFVTPYLERRCAKMDYSIYHLDGPGAVKHLPQLLTVPHLTAIEWTPGAGNPYAADPAWWERIWKPVYAAGKSAHVWAVPNEQIEPFLNEFGQRGTLVTTGCDSEAAARRLLENSTDWGA